MEISEASNKFVKDLEAGKFKREKCPNPPPYFKGTKEEIEESSKYFEDFLNSDMFELLKNL